jgi:hypothetical protein
MTRILEKQKAIELRLAGYSYGQIKKELGLSKSTLSGWLTAYPLSDERIRELRDWSQIRIEKCRNTKALRKQGILQEAFIKAKKEIGQLSKRELFLSALFLYWGEGSKTSRGKVVFSNTDPHMITLFLTWLRDIEIPETKIVIRLQLYKDMSVYSETAYWSNFLEVPITQFRKAYIKKSNLKDISYKNGYGHGTCSVMVFSVPLYDRIMQSIRYCKESLLR